MTTFTQFLNEVKKRTDDKFVYRGFSNSDNIPGVGGTYLYLKVGSFTFGITLMAFEDKFSCRISPFINGDWRQLNFEDKQNFYKYFGTREYTKEDELAKVLPSMELKLEFLSAKEFIMFINKNIDEPEDVYNDLFSKTKEKIPKELKDMLIKKIKLDAFQKKFYKADDLEKIMLLIKKYKTKIDPTDDSIYIEDGRTHIATLRVDKNYGNNINFSIDEDSIFASLSGRGGKFTVQLLGNKDDVRLHLESTKILAVRQGKLFHQFVTKKIS